MGAAGRQRDLPLDVAVDRVGPCQGVAQDHLDDVADLGLVEIELHAVAGALRALAACGPSGQAAAGIDLRLQLRLRGVVGWPCRRRRVRPGGAGGGGSNETSLKVR